MTCKTEITIVALNIIDRCTWSHTFRSLSRVGPSPIQYRQRNAYRRPFYSSERDTQGELLNNVQVVLIHGPWNRRLDNSQRILVHSFYNPVNHPEDDELFDIDIKFMELVLLSKLEK